MEGDRVGQWRWGSPPPLSQGGTSIAVCWYGGRGDADEVAQGPGARAEGAMLDGMNPVATCWYGGQGITQPGGCIAACW